VIRFVVLRCDPQLDLLCNAQEERNKLAVVADRTCVCFADLRVEQMEPPHKHVVFPAL
jgi:hypothetical protein